MCGLLWFYADKEIFRYRQVETATFPGYALPFGCGLYIGFFSATFHFQWQGKARYGISKPVIQLLLFYIPFQLRYVGGMQVLLEKCL